MAFSSQCSKARRNYLLILSRRREPCRLFSSALMPAIVDAHVVRMFRLIGPVYGLGVLLDMSKLSLRFRAVAVKIKKLDRLLPG